MTPSLLLLHALQPAHAAPVTWDGHAWGTWRGQGPVATSGGGLGGAVGWAPLEPLVFEALGQVGLASGGGLALELRPELRWFPLPPRSDRGDLSVTAGAGLVVRDAAGLGGALGLAWDAPGSGGFAPRVGARVLVGPGEARATQLTIGVTRRRPAPVPMPEVVDEPPPPVEEPPPEPPAEPAALPPLSIEPDDAMVWVPHPWCTWLTTADLEDLRAELGPDAPLAVYAAGRMPARVRNGDGGAVVLPEAPAQGSLVVVARPGDVVTTGELRQTVGGDGVLVITAAQGALQVEVEGGGRSTSLRAFVEAQQAVYRRVADPEPVGVRFPVGRSALSAGGRDVVADLAAHLGEWRVRVEGLASPEGDREANLALAEARAAAVAAELEAAGVAAGRIDLQPPVVAPDDVADPAAWRAARVTPLPPRGDR